MMTPARWLTCMAAAVALCASGCGTPGAPQPPSLRLPDPATDLSAVRAGNQVTLAWTMPIRDTDKVALKGDIVVSICRQEAGDTCLPAGTLHFAPGVKGAFSETLPSQLTGGSPRLLAYFVEIKNRRGRSAGKSNSAAVLAGEAPAPVIGFAAALHKDGVAFHWTVPGKTDAGTQSIRLYRKLISAPQHPQEQSGPKGSNPLAAPKEPAEITLLVDSDTGRALDSAVEYSSAYEYRAQRIARLTIDGRTVELGGELSSPVLITVEDIFPPAVPAGLAAVTAAEPSASPAAVDLSWLPVTDRNLAGYIVYRREGDGPWRRISPAQPVIGPAFHDAEVQPGRAYRYAVTSVSQAGHESARSPEAEEAVPAP